MILGAGCAGLSTCLALLEAGYSGSILLIDSRTEYRDDRTWCFWDVEPTPFTHLARATWDTWHVSDSHGRVTVGSTSTSYVSLSANDFYSFALESISRYPNVELRLGQRATEAEEAGGSARVRTEAGDVWAGLVIDSRGFVPMDTPRADSRDKSTWIPQQFLGVHIRTTRDVFDPLSCTLMDFGVDQSQGLRFMYVLPTSPSEALIEDVYMAERSLDADGYRREIEEYLLSEFGLAPQDYEVLGEERGYIPMTDHRFTRAVSSHVIAVGIAGGATRPSTGYTFLAIQRSCRALVSHIMDGTPDAREPECSLLDAIFLRFLADYPERAPRVFRLLFGRVPTVNLVRFLTERSGVIDHALLIIALPKIPFLVTAARVLARRVARAWQR